jgi:hypothetical protein
VKRDDEREVKSEMATEVRRKSEKRRVTRRSLKSREVRIVT